MQHAPQPARHSIQSKWFPRRVRRSESDSTAQGIYQDLLSAGIRLYEYQPTLMHVKTIVADGVWTVIGSANLDNRSRLINAENIMGIADATLATKLEEVFEEDLGRSEEITFETIDNYSTYERFRSELALLIEKQL